MNVNVSEIYLERALAELDVLRKENERLKQELSDYKKFEKGVRKILKKAGKLWENQNTKNT